MECPIVSFHKLYSPPDMALLIFSQIFSEIQHSMLYGKLSFLSYELHVDSPVSIG
jgi:hypothetical protein